MDIAFDSMIEEAIERGMSEEDIAGAVSAALNKRKNKRGEKEEYLRQVEDYALHLMSEGKDETDDVLDLAFVKICQADEEMDSVEDYKSFRLFLREWVDTAADVWKLKKEVEDIFEVKEDEDGWKCSMKLDKGIIDGFLKEILGA